MKILITGAAGFIASHIADQYIEDGHEVIIVDNLSTGYAENLNKKAKFYLMDICSETLEEVFKIEKPDIVNHHAAQISVPVSVKKPLFDAEVNVKGLINVLENSRKYNVKKIIFISSGGAVYGEAEEYPTSEEYVPIPLSPYAINKFVAEKYLHFYNHNYGLDYTVLRYANVYGPRQVSHGEAGVVSIFIEKLLRNQPVNLYAYEDEPEGMVRDYVYVKDVVSANVKALDKGSKQSINIGTGIETTTSKLLNLIIKILEKETEIIKGPARPGDIRRSCLKIGKARKELDWEPKYNLNQGIIETVRYFQNKFDKKE